MQDKNTEATTLTPIAWPSKTGMAAVTLTPWGARTRVEEPKPKTKSAPSPTRMVLLATERELRWAVWLLSRLPVAVWPAGVHSCLRGMGASSSAWAVVPSAADIDRAAEILEGVMIVQDAFVRRVVLGRAAKQPWASLAKLDPEGRSVRQIQRIYMQAIGSIAFFGKVQDAEKSVSQIQEI